MKKLFFGDNLEVLREHITSDSVDLIYLDPPFNSKRDYNLLFKSPKGHESDAQITAFEDSWHWGQQAEHEYTEILKQGNTDVAEMIAALRKFLGTNDMMAYLVMMCNRLLELHRVLKPTGSLYLHCDPTASHYLKVVLDGVFGKENFRNELIWKRTSAHSETNKYGNIHDVILFYAKSKSYTWNVQYTGYDPAYIKAEFKLDETGQLVKYENLTGAGVSRGNSGKPWRGVDPTLSNRHWAIPNRILKQHNIDDDLTTQEKLERLLAVGRIKTDKDGKPLMRGLKTYLKELPGMPIQSLWTDIEKVGNTAHERLGYPTQKPLALLERIIQTSSNEGDIVLDPFCGCGTAVHAAEKLNRQWVGIDITHLAVSLIEKRMKDAFPGIKIDVEGTPKDLEGAKDLAHRDKYQFQWWACSLVNAQPYQGKKKGSDGGIDGLIFFQDDAAEAKKIIVSVKGGEHVTVTMLKDLIATVEREKAKIGLFVTLALPTKPMKEEAAGCGFYESKTLGVSFPKIQILTIEGLLNGNEQARYPDLAKGGHTFKKAKVEHVKKEQGSLF